MPPTRSCNWSLLCTCWRKPVCSSRVDGYVKFVAHGGDVGSEVTEQLALHQAKALLGIHLTDIPYHHIITADEDKLNKAEKSYQQEVTQWHQTEGAYNAIQSTKPQTLAYASTTEQPGSWKSFIPGAISEVIWKAVLPRMSC